MAKSFKAGNPAMYEKGTPAPARDASPGLPALPSTQRMQSTRASFPVDALASPADLRLLFADGPPLFAHSAILASVSDYWAARLQNLESPDTNDDGTENTSDHSKTETTPAAEVADEASLPYNGRKRKLSEVESNAEAPGDPRRAENGDDVVMKEENGDGAASTDGSAEVEDGGEQEDAGDGEARRNSSKAFYVEDISLKGFDRAVVQAYLISVMGGRVDLRPVLPEARHRSGAAEVSGTPMGTQNASQGGDAGSDSAGVSAHELYHCADIFGDDALAKRCLAHIRNSWRSSNITDVIFSDFARLHPAVADEATDFILNNWDNVRRRPGWHNALEEVPIAPDAADVGKMSVDDAQDVLDRSTWPSIILRKILREVCDFQLVK